MKKSLGNLGALMLACLFVFVGCKPSAPASDATTAIEVIGSSSIENLALSLADNFRVENPDIKVNIQAPGSSVGIKAALDATADIGMSSRSLKGEEKSAGLKETVIALDGIAVIVHKDNPVKELTANQITKIFNGEISNWADVGGRDEEILLISREAGSGTRDAFEELMGLIGEDKSSLIAENKALFTDSTNAISQNVAGKIESIGYVSLGSYVEGDVVAVTVDGIACKAETVRNGTYKIARPFIFILSAQAKPEAQLFIDFILGDKGQEIVAQEKYIPISNE